MFLALSSQLGIADQAITEAMTPDEICSAALSAVAKNPQSPLSATDSDYRYLENLQRAMYGNDEIASKEVRRDDTEAQVRCVYLVNYAEKKWCAGQPPSYCLGVKQMALATMTKVWSIRLPTIFEDPIRYPILQERVDELLSAAAKKKIKVPQKIVWGTAPTTLLSASSRKAPGTGTPIILTPREFYNFTLLFSKAYVQIFNMRVTNEGISYQSLPRNATLAGDGMQRYVEVLFATVVRGRPGEAPLYLIDNKYGAASNALMKGMELFALAHELSHVAMGDLEIMGSQKTPTPSVKGAVIVEDESRSLDQEIRADAIAFQIIEEIWKSYSDEHGLIEAPLGIAAPYLMLRSFHDIENVDQARTNSIPKDEIRVNRSDSYERSKLLRSMAIKSAPSIQDWMDAVDEGLGRALPLISDAMRSPEQPPRLLRR